jgi:hypothetical protein
MKLCVAAGCGWGELLTADSNDTSVVLVNDGLGHVRAKLPQIPMTAVCLRPPPAMEVFISAFDLSGMTLVFLESGLACVEQRAIGLDELGDSAVALHLGDEESSDVALETFSFPFGGQNYSSLCLSSNGFLAMGRCLSDSSQEATLSSHFSLPCVSAFRGDLDPGSGGTVLISEVTGEKLTVQFIGVPMYGSSAAVNFQIDLLADGKVRMVYGFGHPGDSFGSGSGDGYEYDYGDGFNYHGNPAAIIGLSYGTTPPAWYSGIDLSQSGPCEMEEQDRLVVRPGGLY